jgi:hypothetical protein
MALALGLRQGCSPCAHPCFVAFSLLSRDSWHIRGEAPVSGKAGTGTSRARHVRQRGAAGQSVRSDREALGSADGKPG